MDSGKYANVSDAAKLLFVHLMLLADDFGCVSVGATFLRRRCFYDSPSDERIARILCELVDADLVRTYEVDRACYAFIPKFGQRLQRHSLKHPQPPESLYQDDREAKQKFNLINESRTNPTVGQRLANTGQPPEVEEKRREVNTLSDKSDVSPFRESAKKVLQFLNEKTNRAYRPTEANLGLIVARLKDGASEGDCRMVVARKCKEWAGDPKMATYLRPKTLFNRTNFDQYIGECVNVS